MFTRNTWKVVCLENLANNFRIHTHSHTIDKTTESCHKTTLYTFIRSLASRFTSYFFLSLDFRSFASTFRI